MKNNENGSLKELLVIQNDDNILVDARLLHLRLQSGYAFSHWISTRILEFGFKKNEDYFKNIQEIRSINGLAGRKPSEYYLTMDMAKEIAMLERNEIGRSIRRYFIAAEKEARSKQLPVSFDFSKSLKVFDLNGRKLLPYREFLVSIGHAPGGGAYARKKRYPNHFISVNGLDHVSIELASIIGMNWLLIRKRKEVQAMQPLLPLEFGAPLLMKGGQA